jgi:predicted flap endonuclease-1-like 5' DNA nuclease
MSDTYTEFAPLQYNREEIARQGYGTAVSGPGDERLIVLFYNKSVRNVARSKEEGKPVFENRQYIKIQTPGETLNIVDRPVQEQDKKRFPRQWDRYLQGKEQTADGIPLDLLFPENPAIGDTLQAYGVMTVEQLAALSGHAIGTIGMGCQELVNKAAKYLEQAQKGVDFHRFEKAIQEKDREISKLTRQVNELSMQMAKIVQGIPQQPSPSFDVQSAQIAALKQQEILAPEPQTFSTDFKPRKIRSDKGRVRGPRKGATNG